MKLHTPGHTRMPPDRVVISLVFKHHKRQAIFTYVLEIERYIYEGNLGNTELLTFLPSEPNGHTSREHGGLLRIGVCKK